MLRQIIRNAVLDALHQLPGGADFVFSVEAPERAEHGDYATNAAFALAKLIERKPSDLAREISERILRENTNLVVKSEVAGGGFVNITLSDAYLIRELSTEESEGELESWRGRKVMIEFTDPNPFKEFHIGHLYSNVVGESLARILEVAGAVVKRANYQGDVGLHVAKAVWGMKQKLESVGKQVSDLTRESLAERVRFLGQAYTEGARAFEMDDDAKKEITELNRKIFTLDAAVRDLYTMGRAWSLEYFDRLYQRLGTKFDFYYFERDISSIGLALVKEQLERGVFEESEGAVVFPGERYGLHRRVFITSEGLPTYEAKELCLASTKYRDFPYDLSVIVTGSEIIEYFRVLIVALNKIDPALAAKTRHIAHGMVRLARGKMSSRTGEVMRADDLLNEVKDRVRAIMEGSESPVAPEGRPEVAERIAVGAVKYSLLRSSIGQDIIFDIDTSLSLTGDSGPYLQYTHARFKSIVRKATHAARATKATPDVTLDDVEHRLLVKILQLPEAIADALQGYAPNVLANYLYTLAKLANEFYHSHPVIQEPDETKRVLRLKIVETVALSLGKGLNLLGIAAPEEM